MCEDVRYFQFCEWGPFGQENAAELRGLEVKVRWHCEKSFLWSSLWEPNSYATKTEQENRPLSSQPLWRFSLINGHRVQGFWKPGITAAVCSHVLANRKHWRAPTRTAQLSDAILLHYNKECKGDKDVGVTPHRWLEQLVKSFSPVSPLHCLFISTPSPFCTWVFWDRVSWVTQPEHATTA